MRLVATRSACSHRSKELAFLVLKTLQVIYRQLSNQYITIEGALEVLVIDTGDLSSKPDTRFEFVNALKALGTVLSVLLGLIPIVAPGPTTTGGILPMICSFLGSTVAPVSSTDSLIDSKDFAPKVRKLIHQICWRFRRDYNN